MPNFWSFKEIYQGWARSALSLRQSIRMKHLKKFAHYYITISIVLSIPMFIQKEAEYIAWALGSVLIILIVFVVDKYYQNKALTELRADKLNAELNLLKSQVNPHFFFNTLHNLYGLVVNNSPKAPSLILELSEMMRYTIYKGKEDWVTLEEEVNYMESYMNLQKIRSANLPEISFIQNIKNKDFKVAPLLFIILVENAFKHGVEKLFEGAYVHILINEDAQSLQFEIINNFEKGAQKEKGIGLDNLKKRLALSYPNKHSLNINQKENTFKVTLKIDK